MRVITIATAALSLTTAVFAEFKGDKRGCALCLTEAGGLSGCEAKAHGIPSMTCLCNYPGYSVYKGCNYWCAGPEGWPEKAPGNACKNWTTNAMTEMFTTTSTATDDKKVVDRAAFATEQGSHALPLTAAELGSQHLAATTQSHPTIEVTLTGRQATAQSSTPTITLNESEAYSIGLITSVSLSTYPSMTTTITGSLNGTIEARSKVTQGPYHFCGVPGGACPDREGDIEKATHGPSVFCGVPGAPCGGKVNDILPTSHPVPTILTKRHEGHNDTSARWSNTTDTDFNSTSRPGGQPPTGAAAQSKGRKLDSNKEKVWLIAVLTAGVVAFAQIKRSL